MRFYFQKYHEKSLYNVMFDLHRVSDEDKGKCVYGSYEPNGAWGKAGGRVFSTSISILIMDLWRIGRYRFAKEGLEDFGYVEGK